jgi:phosphoribosylaminoimidazolecarboxamide formyltransferase/IMP cyclohydrolase
VTTARRQALLSVHDKTGVVELARDLAGLGFTILSTGGTAETLRAASLPVVEISDYTGHPEILEGRVKTLHPRVHGGILADPSKEIHRGDMARTGIEPIELVVVNLYPFRQTAARPGVALDDLIEMIDIGGPAMVRAAAKNWRRVGVVVEPADYPRVVRELRESGALRDSTRADLAARAFAHTSAYDAAIRDELPGRFAAAGVLPSPAGVEGFPARLTLELERVRSLRYGENPHQRGALYAEPAAGPGTIAGAAVIQGRELSFNNLLDLDAAWRLAIDLPGPAAVIVKHNNPCGAALGASLAEAFERARRADPVSAFGGIAAFNREVDAAAAAAATSLFLECVIAPGYDRAALEMLQRKTNLRVVRIESGPTPYTGFDLRRVTGGFLVQDWDTAGSDLSRARVASRRAPSQEEIQALDFAWRVARHVKSNAIVLARADHTVGIGAGQMSRVDSVRLARMKAQEPTRGTVLASDAFFPFRDGIDEAAAAGITAVVQPGGSIKDPEVVAAVDEHGVAMLLTGVRHFRH